MGHYAGMAGWPSVCSLHCWNHHTGFGYPQQCHICVRAVARNPTRLGCRCILCSIQHCSGQETTSPRNRSPLHSHDRDLRRCDTALGSLAPCVEFSRPLDFLKWRWMANYRLVCNDRSSYTTGFHAGIRLCSTYVSV